MELSCESHVTNVELSCENHVTYPRPPRAGLGQQRRTAVWSLSLRADSDGRLPTYPQLFFGRWVRVLVPFQGETWNTGRRVLLQASLVLFRGVQYLLQLEIFVACSCDTQILVAAANPRAATKIVCTCQLSHLATQSHVLSLMGYKAAVSLAPTSQCVQDFALPEHSFIPASMTAVLQPKDERYFLRYESTAVVLIQPYQRQLYTNLRAMEHYSFQPEAVAMSGTFSEMIAQLWFYFNHIKRQLYT